MRKTVLVLASKVPCFKKPIRPGKKGQLVTLGGKDSDKLPWREEGIGWWWGVGRVVSLGSALKPHSSPFREWQGMVAS